MSAITNESLDIRYIEGKEPEVSFTVNFKVHDPAKLISAWAQTTSGKQVLLQDADEAINWAGCIKDLLMENLDELAWGIELDSSEASANPELSLDRCEFFNPETGEISE